MSHFLTVPINENGIIIDGNIDLEIAIAAATPFQFTDVFVYSHGWRNTASTALSEYNIFSIGFSKVLQTLVGTTPNPLPRVDASFCPLGIGIHWPSSISDDQDSVLNFVDATSFFTMEHRADQVGRNAGYALLRLMIEARTGRPPLRFHLIGHSFGCRVVCSALQALTQDAATLAAAQRCEFNVALLQAACDHDSLCTGRLYGDVQTMIPQLRLLVTTSQNDTALGRWYPAAQNLAHLFSNAVPALGSAGPAAPLTTPITDQFAIAASSVPTPAGDFVVVDLTPLHKAHAAAWGDQGGWGGQHSDINLPEIYELLARFFGS